LSVIKRVVEKVADIVLDLFMFVVVFLGLILSVDFVGLSIYFILQGVSWNFYALSWVLLVEGLILMMIGAVVLMGALALEGRESLEGTSVWYMRVICKFRPLSLSEVKQALALLVIGIILFFSGLILLGT